MCSCVLVLRTWCNKYIYSINLYLDISWIINSVSWCGTQTHDLCVIHNDHTMLFPWANQAHTVLNELTSYVNMYIITFLICNNVPWCGNQTHDLCVIHNDHTMLFHWANQVHIVVKVNYPYPFQKEELLPNIFLYFSFISLATWGDSRGTDPNWWVKGRFTWLALGAALHY